MKRVFVTQRNLKTLIAKLNAVAAGEQSFCTITKHDDTHPVYPQTDPVFTLTSVEEGLPARGDAFNQIYLRRKDMVEMLSALTEDVTRDFVDSVSNIQMTAIRDDEYYTDREPGPMKHISMFE